MIKSIKCGLAVAICLLVGQLASADPFKLQASATSITNEIQIGTTLYLTAGGSGKANHVGNFTFTAPHVFDLIAGTYTSDAYVMASNGDVLHIVGNGQFTDAVDSVVTWNIVGGTGRFANATGSGTGVNLNFGASITYTGTINSVLDN